MNHFITNNRKKVKSIVSVPCPFLLVQIKLFNKKTIIFLTRFNCFVVFKIRSLEYSRHFKNNEKSARWPGMVSYSLILEGGTHGQILLRACTVYLYVCTEHARSKICPCVPPRTRLNNSNGYLNFFFKENILFLFIVYYRVI